MLIRTFSSNTLMQFFGELELESVGLEEVNVDIETSSRAICDGRGEGFVGFAETVRGRVFERFAVFVEIAWSC